MVVVETFTNLLLLVCILSQIQREKQIEGSKFQINNNKNSCTFVSFLVKLTVFIITKKEVKRNTRDRSFFLIIFFCGCKRHQKGNCYAVCEMNSCATICHEASDCVFLPGDCGPNCESLCDTDEGCFPNYSCVDGICQPSEE